MPEAFVAGLERRDYAYIFAKWDSTTNLSEEWKLSSLSDGRWGSKSQRHVHRIEELCLFVRLSAL